MGLILIEPTIANQGGNVKTFVLVANELRAALRVKASNCEKVENAEGLSHIGCSITTTAITDVAAKKVTMSKTLGPRLRCIALFVAFPRRLCVKVELKLAM